MTPDEARRLLGLPAGSGPDAVRAAYRARIRAVHPDHHGGDARATAATAALNEAFRVLRATAAAPAPPAVDRRDAAPSAPVAEPAPSGASGSVVLRPDGDSLAVAAPAGDVFLWLHSALHGVGEVTYVDPESGLLEAVVEEASGNWSSVVVTLQGRSDGTTEAFCSAERIAGEAPVDLGAIVDRIVDRLVAGG